MSARETADAIFIAAQGENCTPHWLARLDRSREKVVWRSRVLSEERNGVIAHGGPPSGEIAEFVLKDSRLLLFGIAGTTAYVEGFDAATGRPLFRCSTNYAWVSAN
jgi:hypothetical protein